MTHTRLALPLLLACCGLASAPQAIEITTNIGSGADAEVRESNPAQNRGSSTELGTRAKDAEAGGSNFDNLDRNSVIYLKFDLGGLIAGDAASATLRMTYRNNNLTPSRVTDTDGNAPDHGQNGLLYYGIDGATFNENTINYDNAPGLSPDGDVGTMDFSAAVSYLGTADFPEVTGVPNLPVGGALDFSNDTLANFVQQEILTNPSGVAVIAVTHRNLGLTSSGGKGGDEPFAWTNFNYLFNTKEQTTLNTDLNSPWSDADNSNGEFSPRLILSDQVRTPVPAPAPWLLIATALGGMSLSSRARTLPTPKR
jgi:hypothetical protein